MYNIKTLAMSIRSARLQRNYSQDYLALKLNMTQNGYSKIELGQSKVSVERLIEICDVLDVNPAELIQCVSKFQTSLQTQTTENPVLLI
jgi:transcriptional regulator with XRE-family HTH domain